MQQAIRAESQLAAVLSWDDAIMYYQKNRHCDDGALRESYTNLLANKLSQSDGLTTLWQTTARRRWFRSVVAQRMESEVISAETTRAIDQNLSQNCPIKAKQYCRRLHDRIIRLCETCGLDR